MNNLTQGIVNISKKNNKNNSLQKDLLKALEMDDELEDTTRNNGHRTPLASSVVGLSRVGLVIL